MKCNVGATDRLIRIISGLIIVILGMFYRNWWGLIGLIPLLTGIFRFCPLYVLFKISTLKKN